MKKTLLTISLLASSILGQAQTTELWAGARWGDFGIYDGLYYRADGNGNCAQLAYAFDTTIDGTGGYGGLLAASNGLVYGTASEGGLNGNGVIFEINPVTGAYSKKWDFDGANGDFPIGNLLEASNGKLYGLTQLGGSFNKGVLFEYDIALDTCITRYHFNGTTMGNYPANYLIQATNGKLYGSTVAGGTSNNGTLFEYDPLTFVFTKLVDFNGLNGLGNPYALLQSSTGKFFGYTGLNAIFSFDLGTLTLTKRCDLNNESGGNGGLIEAPNGKLYGVSRYGGDTAIGGGSIFEFDTVSNTLTRIVPVAALGTDTYYPGGTLFLASNGKMYGTSDYYDYFEYDYVNDIFISKLSTQDAFGASEPRNMRFIEVTRNNSEYVWPGDCNRDGVADQVDFLYIGLAYLHSGMARACDTTGWIAQVADNWTDTLAGGLNSHNADANGDGLVTADDSVAIQLNFGMTHALRPAHSQSSVYDFQLVPDHLTVLPGDTIRYTMTLTSGIPGDSLYGIAFTLSFDSSLAEPVTGAVQYASSTLGTIGTNMISMEQDFYPDGLIHAAVTRTDHTNATGLSGSLGTFSLVVPSGITAFNVALIVTPQNITGVTASGNTVGFNAISDTVHINAPSGIQTPLNNKDLTLYPNPSNDKLTVRLKNEAIQTIELFDAAGRRIYVSNPSTRETAIATAQFAEGVYALRVTTGRGVLHQKIVVSHPW